MTSDAGERLADIGRRVLRLARAPVTLQEIDRIPCAYEDLILDPMVALSDTCEALPGWSREPSPAARRERPTREAGLHTTPGPEAYPHPLSYTAGEAPRDPRGGYGSQAGSRTEDLGSSLPGARIPGTVGTTLFAQARRASEPLRNLLEEERQTHPGSPETPTPPYPGVPTARGADSSRRPSGRGFEPNGAPSGRSPSSEVRGPTQRPARHEWQEERWNEQSATAGADDGTSPEAREGGISFSTSSQGRRHGFDPSGTTAQPTTPEAQIPATDDTPSVAAPPDTALTSSSQREEIRWTAPPDEFASEDQGETTGVSEAGAERLAAMLRAHVAAPDPETRSDGVVSPDDPVSPARTQGGRDAGPTDGRTPPHPVISSSERERSLVSRGTVPSWRTPDEAQWTSPWVSALGGSRLATGADRLAAMLRAHVADPEDRSSPPSYDEAETPPSPPAEGVGRVNLEEIIERLAEELEDGIARTYGSSGG